MTSLCECRDLWGHPWVGAGTQVLVAGCPVHGGVPLEPLNYHDVLWVAALDLVPIEERIEWVKTMLERIEQINAVRRGE